MVKAVALCRIGLDVSLVFPVSIRTIRLLRLYEMPLSFGSKTTKSSWGGRGDGGEDGQNMKDRDADLLIDEEEEEEEERGESRKETTEGLTGSGFYRQPENGRETQQMEVMRSRALGGTTAARRRVQDEPPSAAAGLACPQWMGTFVGLAIAHRCARLVIM